MPELQQLENLSVQRNDVETADPSPTSFGFLNWVVRAGETISPWWSQARDRDLRKFPLGSDHLSGAIYAIVARMSTIPFQIRAKDPTIDRHLQVAATLQDSMENMTSFGKGWNQGYGCFILDLLTQDNGGFMEILGKGDPSGPIEGLPMGLNQLDSAHVTRTRNPEYPAVYTDSDGNKFKMHYTRVIDMVSMPSSDIDMNGIGFCGCSRAINTAQHLIDISVYEQEKLGSRPPRGILVGSKVSTRDLASAIFSAESQMDNKNLSRFAKMILVGNPTMDISIDRIDLASIPDGFEKQTSIQLGMAAIALAMGVDLRELWPATITGATKADASLQHMKARGKAIGEILQQTKRKIEQKFLPPYLELVHDYTDDEEDAAQASIMSTRSTSYETLMGNNIITERIARERLLQDGTITPIQFETMELQSGRLKDGEPVLTLFMSTDRETRQMLSMDLRDPLDFTATGPEVISKIDYNIRAVTTIYINTSSDRLKRKAAACLAALNALREEHVPEVEEPGSKASVSETSGPKESGSEAGPKTEENNGQVS